MPRLPESIGKYRILERLGRGGMSVIYKGEHPTLGRPVVLKKLMLKGNAAHRDRFRREAALMMGLRHDNVVGVYDHFQEGGGHFLVMEYVEGASLAELLAREGALEASEVQWLTGRIALALAHVHARGIVHRDIKPSNVLLGSDGSVKLGDFGIAFVPDGGDDVTSSGTTLGTPGFMAPEQLEDARSADRRSDMWSLGVCCFEMLTGRKFVTGATPAAIREALPETLRDMARRLPDQMPRTLRRFLKKTLRMRPEARLSGGRAAVRLLGAVDGEEAPGSLMVRLEKLILSLSGSRPEGQVAGKRAAQSAAQPAAQRAAQSAAQVSEARDYGGANSGRLRSGKAATDKPFADKAAAGSLFAGPPFAGRLQTGQAAEERRGGSTQKYAGSSERSGRRPVFGAVFSAGKNRAGKSRVQQKRRLYWLAGPAAALVLLAVLVPGAWERCFRRRSTGVVRLELAHPLQASRNWLEGVRVTLYREEEAQLRVVARPRLRPAEHYLRSRNLYLPPGAYRLEWSLGDTVSWTSFQLPSLVEQKKRQELPLVRREVLAEPPVFPLEVEWMVRDAVSGRDIAVLTEVSRERLDAKDGETPVSGGRYRFVFSAPGYLSSSFVVPVSPWRRHLRLEAALWPQPARIVIENSASRAALPRVNGAGQLMDLSESPSFRRLGRLEPGGTLELHVLPGSYSVSPALGRGSVVELQAVSGETVFLVILDDKGAEDGGKDGGRKPEGGLIIRRSGP